MKFNLIKYMTVFITSIIFCAVFICGLIFHFYTGLPEGTIGVVVTAATAIGTITSIAWLIDSTTDFVRALKENAKHKYVFQWDDSMIEHWDGVMPPHMGPMYVDPQYDNVEHFDGIFPPIQNTRKVGILEDITEAD